MALKGPIKVMGSKLTAPEGYAVINSVTVSKGGDAFCHVEIYATPPETLKQEQTKIVQNEEVKEMVDVTDRGPVLDHFSVGGIKTNGKDPFVAAYEQIRDLDGRLAGMADAV